MTSDSDFAGLYSITGETRSRTGTFFSNNGFPVSWRSSFQDLKATSGSDSIFKVEAEIATSTGFAETVAMAESTKTRRYLSFIADELRMTIPSPLMIQVDAAAAKGFADSLGKSSRMKHIDVRKDWVKMLRDRGLVSFTRIAGTDNIADFFTKILGRQEFKRWEDEMMGILPEYLR